MNIVYTTHLLYLLLSECIYSQVIVCTTPPSDCMSYYHVNPSDGIYYGVISVLPMDWSYLTINGWSTIPQKSSISFNISRIIEDRPLLADGFKYLFLFTPKIGEMIQFDLRIFFRWLGEKPPSRLYLHRHFPSFCYPTTCRVAKVLTEEVPTETLEVAFVETITEAPGKLVEVGGSWSISRRVITPHMYGFLSVIHVVISYNPYKYNP